MKLRRLLWCPEQRHTFLQLQELLDDNTEIDVLENKDPELFNKIVNINNKTDIDKLVSDVYHTVKHYDTVVLPIGNPQFMYRLSITIWNMLPEMSVLVSHMDTKSTVYNDGTMIAPLVHFSIPFIHLSFKEVNTPLNQEP